MAAQPVEAVFFFRWDKQTSQATYNRISESTRYTKNYIQVSGEPGDILDQVFGRSGDDEVALMWRWPGDGGGQPGKLRLHKGEPGKAKRVHLVWDQAGKAPQSWKLGDPAANPIITIPGDPTGATAAEADEALADVTDADVRPWFVAVKLVGEPDQLHARAYLENPPNGLEPTDLALLPSGLLAAIKALDGGSQSGWYKPVGATPPTARAKKIVSAIQTALASDPNVLLVGPPGTGKTVALEDLRAIVEHEDVPLTFDPDLLHDAFADTGTSGKVISLVFHSSYAYENFVAGLVPTTHDGQLRLDAQAGPLISLAHWAAGSTRRALLILDEFNRGPTAAIFGDTLALLDGSKRHDPPAQPGAHITRPFPETSMQVPVEYANADGSRDVPPELRLPMNLRIVAALNSSDRSVAPLDAALRRRFAIIPVAPDLVTLAEHLAIDVPQGTPTWPADADAWAAGNVKQLAVRLLARLNERIAFVLSDDFLLGHALFWPVGEVDDAEIRSVLCTAFDERIVQSLRLTFTDQDELLAAVLAAGDPSEPPPTDPRVAKWQQPSSDLEAVAAPRLRLEAVSSMSWPDALVALLAVLD